jgi:hypothetical protein
MSSEPSGTLYWLIFIAETTKFATNSKDWKSLDAIEDEKLLVRETAA